MTCFSLGKIILLSRLGGSACLFFVWLCDFTSGAIGDNNPVSHIEAFVYDYGYLGDFSLLDAVDHCLLVPNERLLVFEGDLIIKGYFHIVPTLVMEGVSEHVA
jgi:hypothetical protein